MKYNKRVDDFLNMSKDYVVSHNSNNVSQKFDLVFKNFKSGATAENIRQLYAESFYFNDTFKTITKIDELVRYMEETASNVDITTVEILDVAKSDSDYYLRWSMTMKFTAKGTVVESNSIGMTQLRFNSAGKVILHQDYWDGAEGFYQHLPFVGYVVRKIRDSL